MGRYRLILALYVLATHCGIKIAGHSPGDVAVISFYILSGYVMTLLIEKHYAAPDRTGLFYADRAARLCPQFLFYLGVTAALFWAGAIKTPWLSEVSGVKLGLNALILPLGFYMPRAFDLERAMFLPQAWSLGLEITFYLLAPFLISRLDDRGRMGVAAGSFGIFLLAVFGAIDTEYFGYRLLPGTLFIFIIGVFLARNNRLGNVFVCCAAAAVVALLALIHSGAGHLDELGHNKEVLLGILVGTAFVALLRELPPSRWDDFFGNLSYGVFLNHFMIIWVVQTYLGNTVFSSGQMALVIAVSLAGAVVSYEVVEKPVIAWRRQFRRGAGTEAGPEVAVIPDKSQSPTGPLLGYRPSPV